MYRKKRRSYGRKKRHGYKKHGYGKKSMKSYYVSRGGIRL